MENINIGTFLEQLTHYIKLGIYVNKGTNKEDVLTKCIDLHNKLNAIRSNNEVSPDDEAFIRRCVKRFNLMLKTGSDGNPIDLKNKENQVKILEFNEHIAIKNNNLKDMCEYADKFNINILTGIPLTFILRQSKYQDLLWNYTMSLYYISQLLFSKTSETADLTNPVIIFKRNIFDESAEKLELILCKIAETEEEIETEKILSLDKFLSSKLKNSVMTSDKINEAKDEMKKLFNKKGLGENNAISKMMDSITGQLGTIGSGGNPLESIINIAKNVAKEMQGELGGQPENLRNTLTSMAGILKDTVESSDEGNQMPPEFKNIFNSLFSSVQNGQNNPDNDPTEEINNSIETLANLYGLNRQELNDAIRGEDGDINVDKFEQFMSNVKPKNITN
ncbi:hypothetical protein QLL95_gp1050 [Cotonvirus japonicus]|uniref:Uncharacterized protein n=1 Tax=Cotonvirus japonicus TaxID=2811091 RepID=A0ABM7NSE6_9VIRU|nr:hypothetical protein QLL95_gp1050 [Cotonvirus japonicus]BCS83073.1 hypothetical protein [Cotonvirus japonicus]